MFTKNWYKAIAGAMTGSGSSLKESTNRTGGACPSTASTAQYTFSLLGTNKFSPTLDVVLTEFGVSSSSKKGGVVFGTGTTPPTLDDITMSGDLVTGISCSIGTSYEWQDDGVVYVGNYTITNNNSTDITIGEVCLFACNDIYYEVVLMERTVLDTPITIPAGGFGQVEYTIRMNFPTA